MMQDVQAEEDVKQAAGSAADKIRAAVTVLQAVQEMRYNGTRSGLCEAMRQTAVASLQSAGDDARRAWQAVSDARD